MKIVSVVGGLGSQMMAYGLYLSLKEAYPNECVILDFSSYLKYGRSAHNGAELNRIFGISEDSAPSWLAYVLHSRSFLSRFLRYVLPRLGVFRLHRAELARYNFDQSVFLQDDSLVVFDQCWTSWKYFEKIESNLRAALKFPNFSNPQNLQISQKMRKTESIAIHVRRGDYLTSHALGGLIGLSFYLDGIEYIKQKLQCPTFFIFSDDPVWCRENLLPNLDSDSQIVDWNKSRESYVDMQLMSCCKHHIIPNSSFSWWGAYLAKHETQIVVTPRVWVRPESGLEMKDMNLPHWYEIDNLGCRASA